MKNYFDGLFYTYYWRCRLKEDKGTAVSTAICNISGIILVLLVSSWLLVERFFQKLFLCKLLSNNIVYLLFMPIVFVSFYFLWNKRYKRIIRQHNLYKNSFYNRFSIACIIVSMGILSITIFILAFT